MNRSSPEVGSSRISTSGSIRQGQRQADLGVTALGQVLQRALGSRRSARPIAVACSKPACGSRRRTSRFADRHPVVELRPFRHVADAMAKGNGIGPAIAPRIVAVPALGGKQAGQHSDGRGLSRSVASQESEDGQPRGTAKLIRLTTALPPKIFVSPCVAMMVSIAMILPCRSNGYIPRNVSPFRRSPPCSLSTLALMDFVLDQSADFIGRQAAGECFAQRFADAFANALAPFDMTDLRPSGVTSCRGRARHHAEPFQILKRLGHGVGMHIQAHRQLAHTWNQIASRQTARGDVENDLGNDLFEDRVFGIGIDIKPHGIPHRPACHTLLVR